MASGREIAGVYCFLRVAMASFVPTVEEAEAIDKALKQQSEEGEHDRSLIVERLGWTPEQRLAAHTGFLRFFLSVRPDGPLIRE